MIAFWDGKVAPSVRVAALICTLFHFAIPSAGQNNPNLQLLYRSHQWFELRDAMSASKGPVLYRGAVAAAFNRQHDAEKLLGSVIKAAPRSSDADEARQWLEYLYFRAGQYPRALTILDQGLTINRDDDNARSFRTLVAAFPEAQSVSQHRFSRIRYHMVGGNMAIPVSSNGITGNYIVDSDLNISMLSESEAKRLGLSVQSAAAGAIGITGATGGAHSDYRIAVADQLAVGNMRLRHVAFIVVGDNQGPFVGWPPGERGLLALPVLLAFRTLRWTTDGNFEMGFPSKKFRQSNLCFDGSDPLTQGEFQERKLDFVFDMGSEKTDLWPPFAKQFAALVSEKGKKGSWPITGLSGSEEVESVTLPEVGLRVGGFDAVLRPAHVLLKRTTENSQWYYARIGMNLLNQARQVTIDFSSMALMLN